MNRLRMETISERMQMKNGSFVTLQLFEKSKYPKCTDNQKDRAGMPEKLYSGNLLSIATQVQPVILTSLLLASAVTHHTSK